MRCDWGEKRCEYEKVRVEGRNRCDRRGKKCASGIEKEEPFYAIQVDFTPTILNCRIMISDIRFEFLISLQKTSQ
jgi:hypothetical protein